MVSNIEMLGMLDELLGDGKDVRLRIKGRSMMPFLRDGLEQVDLSTPNDTKLIPGALVLFRYQGGFILHRVIRRKENKLLIMGDNIYQSREVVTTDQVIGIVHKIIYPGERELSTDSRRWKILSACWLMIKPVYRLSMFIVRRGIRLLGILK